MKLLIVQKLFLRGGGEGLNFDCFILRGSIFSSENKIYPSPLFENDIFSSSRDTSFFDCYPCPSCLNSFHFCIYFILLLPIVSFSFPLFFFPSPFSFFFPLSSFFVYIFSLFLIPFSQFSPNDIGLFYNIYTLSCT
jgi:hypothetical protein